MNDSLEDYIHFISDSPQSQQISSTTKETLLVTLQKKRECEVRAMKTLEFLIEGRIRPEVFFRCIKHLNRSYYSDVIEERSISKLCGYCLCDSQIKTMPKKQFAIDSKHNKIYDVTNRKKFCSDYCYKASIHIEKQIDDSPLWLRNPEDFPKYTLLPATDRGIPGDDLGSDSVVQKEQAPFASACSFAEVSLQEITEVEKPKETPKVELSKNISIKQNLEKVDREPDTNTSKPVLVPKKVKKDKVKRKNKIQLLKQYVLEWLTIDTYVFLFGEERVKKSLTELDLSKMSDISIVLQKELAQLCKKLSLSDCGDSEIERMTGPSYKQIKKENKDINVKVRSFYSGSGYEVKKKNEPELSNGETVENSEPDILPIGNPPNVIRQNVFLSSIKNAMKILTENLGISWGLVLKELEALVKTFALQPHSVVFQPVEWNLIALILIKMLSYHDGAIRELLNAAKSQTFINSSVSSLSGIQSMLNELFINIEDINLFFKRHVCMNDAS